MSERNAIDRDQWHFAIAFGQHNSSVANDDGTAASSAVLHDHRIQRIDREEQHVARAFLGHFNNQRIGGVLGTDLNPGDGEGAGDLEVIGGQLPMSERNPEPRGDLAEAIVVLLGAREGDAAVGKT